MDATKQTLYLECSTGISGDMTVAALLDLGANPEVLQQALESLPISGFQTKISRVKKSGIDACDFDVQLDAHHQNHDHDMKYLYGHTHGEIHGHNPAGMHEHNPAGMHEHNPAGMHEHNHESMHEHSHGEPHSHTHCGIREIRKIIMQGNLTEGARTLAFHIFDILAAAEAKAHCVPVEEVHFHEVGAVDSIVDIVSAAVCLDNLGISDVIVTGLSEGRGTVRCQHGILPIPVPAVSNILHEYRLPVHFLDLEGELVTPTGAAIVAAICTTNQLPERFIIENVGIGAGKRTYDRPSLLRAMLIQAA